MSSSTPLVRLVSFLAIFNCLVKRCAALSVPPPPRGDPDNGRNAFLTTRRSLIGTLAVPAAWNFISPQESMAAEPINSKDTDSLLAIAKRKLRPQPPKVLRRKLSQDFAVLLMRSSYSVLDELDCVAMDQFQRDFFLIRSSEYQDYTKALGDGMVQQGDLTDPYYFDFISFAQYQTINRELTQDPPFVFQEMQPGDQVGEGGKTNFVPVVVKRNPSLTNDRLVPTHSARVGSAVLDKLEETFRDTDLRLPKLGDRPDPNTLLSAIQKLVNLFLINGYALRADVSMVPSEKAIASGTKYVVNLQAPAILWSGTVLQMEKEPLSNDFLLKTLTEFIGRAGYKINSSTKFDGTSEEIVFTIV